MKRVSVLLSLSLIFLAGCSKEDKISQEQEIWLNGYKAFSPTSSKEKTAVEFLFFPADNGEKYKTEAKTFNGTIPEYQELKDDIFDLLTDGKMMLENGTIVTAVKTEYVSTLSSTYDIIKLPVGKYFIAAIYRDRKDGYFWLYSTKYTGMYYDLKTTYSPDALSVVFPCDRNRYGYIKWTQWHENFDYDFTF